MPDLHLQRAHPLHCPCVARGGHRAQDRGRLNRRRCSLPGAEAAREPDARPVAAPVRAAGRRERRTATIGAGELQGWLARAAEEGWELVEAAPAPPDRGSPALLYYVILRRRAKR